jgi:acetoin utilization protein AcuB
MLVSKRMTEKPVTVDPDHSLARAQSLMQEGRFRRLPVLQEGELIGIITDRDLREHAGHLEHTKVNVAMTETPLTVTPGITLENAAALMLRYQVGGLPVVDRGAVVGIITATDVLRAFMDVMGASETDTVRIDLTLQGKRHDVAGAFRCIETAGGIVLGLGSYTEKWDTSRVFYVRVRMPDPLAAVDALTEAGYRVLGIHEQSAEVE